MQMLLQSFERLLEALLIPFSVNKKSLIFGFISNNKTDNVITIVIKQYIYKTRCLNRSLNINALINSIKDYYTLQKYIANGKGDKAKCNFEKEWKKWDKLTTL